MCEFLDHVIEGFAQGAPAHHRLVVKEHPLENHREPLRRHAMRKLARRNGIRDRIHYVPGGKLAKLLDDANSAVTVNSTAGQQVLWRGIPLRTFSGRSVYDKPEFVSQPTYRCLFRGPQAPGFSDAYQVPIGSFFWKRVRCPAGSIRDVAARQAAASVPQI